MALAAGLARAGTPPTRLESEATTTFDKVGEGFGITKIDLRIRGQVEGIDEQAFSQAAEGAKENCPGLAGAQGKRRDQRRRDARLSYFSVFR